MYRSIRFYRPSLENLKNMCSKSRVISPGVEPAVTFDLKIWALPVCGDNINLGLWIWQTFL